MITQAGDTFETLARRAYGNESEAGRIAKANPGIAEPLPAGVNVVIPNEDAGNMPITAPAEDRNETALFIDGTRFRFWSGIEVTRSIDTVDAVSFSAPFEPDAPGFRETFRPFSYKPARITVGGDPLFTGTMVDIRPSSSASSRTLDVNCYSRPGVLMDCSPPASAFPIEWDNVSLRTVAKDLAEPFGVRVVFDADPGQPFERVAMDPGGRVFEFLAGLARDRNLVVSSTPEGALWFRQQADASRPVAVLSEGVSPLVSVSPSFSPQDYYSHITGLEPVIVGLDGGEYTVANPHLTDVLRPMTFTVPDTVGSDSEAACRAKIGRMFAAAASYRVELATWRDPSGALWAPNTTIRIEAPGAMVYRPFDFYVRTVTLARRDSGDRAFLDLVMPGSFRGELPEILPWD